ncbi:LRR and PYD domains-containing 3-like protein [Labeo rohita]|uniref:LRR and PYD domains-containing 3-like protein n=1 Tax=Labeo rohita TaxID=84645 RepID=A0A498MIU7_LABRO|nr:LRR and PYD domains-containing 3-like protein [Labeo rohita]
MLKNSLMDLVKIELKEFQWHLQNDHECISNSEIEEADIFDTVNKMVRCFGPGEAVKIAVDILRKMNQNNLAEQLENKHKQAQVEGNMKTSVLVGADSEQSLGSTSMDSKTSLYDYTEISLRLKKQLKQNCERILVGRHHRPKQIPPETSDYIQPPTVEGTNLQLTKDPQHQQDINPDRIDGIQ